MRVSYDPQDVQDLARLVAQELMPLLLAEVRDAASRQPPPVVRQEATSDAQRSPTRELLRAREVRQFIGVSETTLWRLRQGGQFPAPLQLSRNRIGWRRSDVESWLESRR